MGIVCAEKIEASCWTGSFHSHMVQDVACTGLQKKCSLVIHGVFAQCLHFLKLYKLVRLKYPSFLSGCLKARVFFEHTGIEIPFVSESRERALHLIESLRLLISL